MSGAFKRYVERDWISFSGYLWKKIRKCSYPSGNKGLNQRRAGSWQGGGQEVWLGKREGLVGRVSPAWELWFCAVSVGLGGLSRCSFTSAVVIITSISDRLFCLVVGSAIALATVPLLEICPLGTSKWRSCRAEKKTGDRPHDFFPCSRSWNLIYMSSG